MARARSAPARRRRARVVTRAPRPSEAETRLLALARQLAALPRAAGLAAAVRTLADAHAPDAALPRALARARLASRGDKTAILAVAWAREQVRLAVEEIAARAPRAAAPTTDVPTLAWLLLAAAESLAQEPPAAVADRLRALLDLSAPGGAPA
jgi:hypothetical protein